MHLAKNGVEVVTELKYCNERFQKVYRIIQEYCMFEISEYVTERVTGVNISADEMR